MTFFFNAIFGACPEASDIFYENQLKYFDSLTADLLEELTVLRGEFKEAGFDIDELFKEKEVQIDHFCKLKDSIMSYFYFERKYPRQLTDDLYEKLSLVGSLAMVQTYEVNNIQINTSKIIKIIFDEFYFKIIAKSSTRKYFGLSGHDSNMVPLLVGLGLSSVDCLKKCFKARMKIKTEKYSSDNANERICTSDCLGVPGYASNMIFELSR